MSTVIEDRLKARQAGSPEHMDELTARYPTIPTIRRLLAENAKAHIPRYLLAFLLMAATAVCVGGTAWIIKDVINDIFIEHRREMVVPIALGIIAIFSIKGATAYGSTVVLARISANVLAGLQKRMVGKILSQGMPFYDRVTTGEVTARFNQNASAARNVISKIAAGGLRDVLTLIALVTVMIVQEPFLSVLSFVIIPPAILGLNWIVIRVRTLAREQFQAVTRVMTLVSNMVRGVRVIKIFNLEADQRAEFNEAIEAVEQRARKAVKYSAITLPLADTMGGIGIAIIVLYGGFAVIGQGGDAGAFFSFITAFLMAYEPATRLGRLNVGIQRGMVGVRLMFDLLDEPLTTPDAKDAGPIEPGPGAISFTDVSFSYDNVPALRDITIDIQPGEFLAIVGQSGSGKSTLFSLLMRFYDPVSGRVRIDGQDVSEVSVDSLRRAITAVDQDPYLFPGTVRENILMGRPGASSEDVLRVVDMACVAEFVDKLPNGLDTEVGEGGSRLSGGQRQRVAIARALLKDAPIVLFDEATSALDSESERQVQTAFEDLRKGRTTLVIAHRLSTLRNADRVAVFKAGELVELGTHDELLAMPGTFKMLYETQQYHN